MNARRATTTRRGINLAADPLDEETAPAVEPTPAPAKAAGRSTTARATSTRTRAATKTAKAAPAAVDDAPAEPKKAGTRKARTEAPPMIDPDLGEGEESWDESSVKLTVMIPESLYRRAQGIIGASQYLGDPPGYDSMVALVRKAMSRLITEVEEEFHDGQPYKAPQSLRRGRPVGSGRRRP